MRLPRTVLLFLALVASTEAFALTATTTRIPTVLHDKKMQRDIEERSLRNAKGGMGETAAGAVLGGLLLGPFGTCTAVNVP